MDEAADKVVSEDYQARIQQYEDAAKRMEKILERVGIREMDLSPTTQVHVRSMAELAVETEVKDVSLTSYILAINHLKAEARKTASARATESRCLNQLLGQTAKAVQKLDEYERALGDAEKRDLSKCTARQEREASYLRRKCDEYKSRIRKYEKTLLEVGTAPELFHSELVKQSQQIEKVREQIEPLRQAIDSYNNLPADVNLAKLKVQELRRKVDALEAELCESVAAIHM